MLPDGYWIAGDNNAFIERDVTDDMILGVMAQVLRNGKSITPDNFRYRCYVHLGDPIQGSDSVIYYFYKDYCGYCRELEPLTAGLPQQITLPDGTASAVKFIGLNKVEDQYLQIINAYYEEHDIPAERRYVPAVVIGDQYLFLKDEIVPGLLDALTAGKGLNTPLLDGSKRMAEE